jgi:HEAT repeat protein
MKVFSARRNAMMMRNENLDLKQAPFYIRRPALSVIIMLTTLFFMATLLQCAGQQSPLRERLLSSDERTKRSAFKELNSLNAESKKKYLEIMKNMLTDKNPENQLLAAEALGHMGPAAEEAIPDLVQALSGDNEALRSRAIKALAEIGPTAVPSLITALNHQDKPVRIGAADALGSMGPRAKEAIPALAAMLSDRDREIAQHASSALGLIGPAAVPELIHVARRGDRYATDMAATAFSRLKADTAVVQELTRLLGNANEEPGVRGFAAKALGNMPEKAQTAQSEIMRALGDENDDVRTAARWALGQIGPKAIPALREALKDGNPRIRSGAAFALGSMGPAAEDTVPALLQAMKDEDRTVRIDAILAIGKIKVTSKAVVQALNQVLETDKDEVVRLDAVRVLNKIDTTEAKEAVLRYNKKNSPQ